MFTVSFRHIVAASVVLIFSVVSIAAVAEKPQAGSQSPEPPGIAIYSGTYSHARLILQLNYLGGGKYVGTIAVAHQTFLLTAIDNGQALEGTFQSRGTEKAFTATLYGDKLLFKVGRATFVLLREGSIQPVGKQ